MLVLRLPKVVLFGVGKSRSLLSDREAGEGWSPATRLSPLQQLAAVDWLPACSSSPGKVH